jgi:hypothetical protein
MKNAADQQTANNQLNQQDLASASARANGGQLHGAVEKPAKPDPAESSCTVQPDGSVLLIKPRLELMGSVHWDRTDIRTMQKEWHPERALIVGSVIVIEEWNIVLPIAYVHIARWNYKAPTVPAAT